MNLSLRPDQSVASTLEALTDRSLTIEDRAAMYGLLQQVSLRIGRGLRSVKDEIIVYMESNGLRDLGPLSIKATAIDVRWPCNAEDNWGDAEVQYAMAQLRAEAPEYVRHVPEHYEVNTAALGAGVAAGDPLARRIHRELKDKKWRTEAGRSLSLAVREAKPKERAA